MSDLIEGEDYYCEDGLFVFTREYHLRRGWCCGSGCRHCPYEPRWQNGNTFVAGDSGRKRDNETEESVTAL